MDRESLGLLTISKDERLPALCGGGTLMSRGRETVCCSSKKWDTGLKGLPL